MTFSIGRQTAFAACLAILGIVGNYSGATAAGADFSGKTVVVAIGYAAGGGFDAYGRLLARFLGDQLPGKPTVIAQNVVGAGSLKLATRLYEVSPKDGTEIGLLAQTLPIDQVLGAPGINFDFKNFNAVGRMAPSPSVIIAWHTVPVTSIEDVKKTQVMLAATGPSSDSSIQPALLNNLVGTKFKIVNGYAGTNEMMLALERGEAGALSIIASSLSSSFARFMEDKRIRVLAAASVERLPEFPDVPTMVELASSEEDKKIMRLFASSGDIGRAFYAPPGVPAERVRVLRDVFMRTLDNPALKEQAKRAELDLGPMHGEDLQKLIADATSGLSESLVAKALRAKVSK